MLCVSPIDLFLVRVMLFAHALFSILDLSVSQLLNQFLDHTHSPTHSLTHTHTHTLSPSLSTLTSVPTNACSARTMRVRVQGHVLRRADTGGPHQHALCNMEGIDPPGLALVCPDMQHTYTAQ